jgi:predicted nucleic acid-binding protein
LSGFLLDTNVLSEPTKKRPNPGVIEWLETLPDDLIYVSVISLGEIRRGIDRLASAKKKSTLERFLFDVNLRYSQNTLAVDTKVADRWGRLVDSLEKARSNLTPADALIAATALEHSLTIASRDADFYAVAGVSRFNPFR